MKTHKVESMKGRAIARTDTNGDPCQTVQEHLVNVAELATKMAAKIGMPTFGTLLGLLHDFGKFGHLFQDYILDGRIAQQGKVDHSTAGAQYVWRLFENGAPLSRGAGQILALCIASHHGGLIDCLSPQGEPVFLRRMAKPEDKTCLQEVLRQVEPEVRVRLDDLFESDAAKDEMKTMLGSIRKSGSPGLINSFRLGLVTRFLYSALVDADRLDAAGRQIASPVQWEPLVKLLEDHIATFKADTPVNKVRAEVAQACLEHAHRPKGLYRLTVPTGGGKTLASLRFALHHAARHDFDRVFYIIPYTSIIDQNARVARDILEKGTSPGSIVLEHHSNLTEDKDTDEARLLAENWDSPIVFTTFVQFLDSFFQAGTRAARRLHNLANAVIVFDEVQTLPLKTVHLFNNAINFLTENCSSSVIFCTATQPLLDGVEEKLGAASFIGSKDIELAPPHLNLFNRLRRVEVCDLRRPEKWSVEEIGDLLMEESQETRTVLSITNTKANALKLYNYCAQRMDNVFHLSTHMCPAHRMDVLERIKLFLQPECSEPMICVSTQLIEAGVDIDFGSVVRFLAGLDSIAQAAGRCNRHGSRPLGKVSIINPRDENLTRLHDIKIGSEISERIFREFHKNPGKFDNDMLSQELMNSYYRYYFYERADEMLYSAPKGLFDRDETLLSLLATNYSSFNAVSSVKNNGIDRMLLKQSFGSAGKAFEVIDSNTTGVIVPYGEGEDLISMLCSEFFDFEEKRKLLRKAQQYSVNLYQNEFLKLSKIPGALHTIHEDSGIYSLNPKFYSEHIGVVFEGSGTMPFYCS